MDCSASTLRRTLGYRARGALSRFDEPIPRELGNLQSLTRLDLADIPFLPGPIPPEFGKLTNLRHLNVSETRLEGAIPQDLISVPLELF